jgi:hypothetical protein
VSSKQLWWTTKMTILSIFFNLLFIAASGPLFPYFRSPSSKRPGISKYYEHGKSLAHSGTFRAPRIPILVFHFFSVSHLGYLQCKYGLKMCPLTLNLIFKVARCVGDHVDISNSAGSSDSAEESFILLNQMVLTGCVPCTLNTPF